MATHSFFPANLAGMATHALFPTYVYTAALERAGSRELNRRLLAEALQLREDDAAGRRWSAANYPGGYTSYGSVHQLQRMSPTFELLRRRLSRHIKAFATTVEWDMEEMCIRDRLIPFHHDGGEISRRHRVQGDRQ